MRTKLVALNLVLLFLGFVLTLVLMDGAHRLALATLLLLAWTGFATYTFTKGGQ